jgi:dipeptidyl aminopeptidase/acylaminoacyl peptidase
MTPSPISRVPSGACVLFALTVAAAAQDIPPTPNEADIPVIKSIDLGLAGDGPPDIVRYLNVRTAGSPSLSPDGEHLAFRTSITGKPQLWTVDSRGGWPRQLTYGESVSFHAWSPRGDWICYGTDRGGNERVGFYLISPDGTRERELLRPSEHFRIFGGFSPDGQQIAYATTERTGVDFDIHVLDVESGEHGEVLQGAFGFFVASWRPDGKALVLSETRGEDGNDVHLLDLESGELTTLFAPEVPSGYGGFAWTPDGGGFYFSSDEGREFSGLAYWDAATGEVSWSETPEHDVGDVRLSHDGTMLSWATNQGGWGKLHVRHLPSGANLPLAGLPPGVFGLVWSPGATVAAISGGGPNVSGDIWTWSPAEGDLQRVTWSDTAGLDMTAMIVPTHVDVPARDGETLHGLLYMPSAEALRRRAGVVGADDAAAVLPPVLLAVHGGPTGQSRPRFNAVHQYLLARGIAVFDLNFRGSTGYGKRFARLDNQRLRPNAVNDMADAIAWLEQDGRVNARRAAVMGGSYGGYMTNAALVSFPDLFRCGVSIVGVSNWITALEGASPALKASDRLEYGDISDPDDRAFFEQLSPLTHVDKIERPLMVMHGANDPRDPVEESDQFVRAIRERGGEVEYLRFPDEGHGVRKLPNRVTAYRRIAAFLEKHLAPPLE